MSPISEPRHVGQARALTATGELCGSPAGAARGCDSSLAKAFNFLGKRWNGVILGTLKAGPAGFAVLSRAVAGISDSVLSDRLAELGQARLVQRVVHIGPPITVTYELTPSGQALMPALDGLARWANAHLAYE